MASNLHVMMLPWSAFGHIIPFFHLSISLARNGVRVSFVSTPRNIQRLPTLPPDVASLVDLVQLRLPRLDGNDPLPEGGEASIDIPFEKIQYLKVAYDLLKLPFEQLVLSKSPDWIFIDFAPYWAIEIGRENGIPVAFFSVFSAASLVFVGPPDSLSSKFDGAKTPRRQWPSRSRESLTVRPPWVDFPSTVAFRDYESAYVYAGFFMENASGVSDSDRLAQVLRSCDVVACRSCMEYEGQYLDLFQRLIHKTVIPVGLLPPEEPKHKKGVDVDVGVGQENEGLRWLDTQEPRTVVFVGFGSECKLTKEQVHELAHGLELSGLPFLWALRMPAEGELELELEEALPDGFVNRTRGRGLVCMGWVPQVDILAHPSIGGSLFHAGWGSVIETLRFGHCLVVLPLISDQSLNASLLVERGLAVEVERNSSDGSFTRNGIADALRLAMVSEEQEGRELRANAREAAKIFGDRELDRQYATKFVEYLKNNVKKEQLLQLQLHITN